jgi:LacI family repressor for deo operon, udp, cdd, tsx, nupC, and nupG
MIASSVSLEETIDRSNLFIANLNLFISFPLNMPHKQNVPIVRSVEEFSKHLGLSRWTVSRILNGHEGVREETRQRVLAEMSRLNFQPNMMARSLRGGKTGLVGVSLQGIESPILARKISGIQKGLHARGLKGVMEVTWGQPEAERSVINHFLSLKVDGIILVGSTLKSDDPIFTRLISEKASVIAVDAAWDVPLPRVELDRHMAMRLCLRHLLQRGRDSFALLGLESDPIYGHRRIEGLKEAAVKLGLSWDESFTSIKIESQSEWSFEYGYAMAKELLQMEVPPRGIIALNDEVAIGAIKAIRELGHGVPQDFSVVGFDNLSFGEWTEPSLTSVAQNVEDMIEKSVQLMQDVSLIEGEYPVVKVAPNLIVRGSS